MNINFEDDLKNNKMRLTVKISKRVLIKDQHIIVGWSKIKEIVEKNYSCPDTHVLGKCHDRSYKMDNNYDQKLEKTYVFDLLPKNPPKIKKPTPPPPPALPQVKKSSTRKTSTKRTKRKADKE
jgi:hypothetical protein